MIQKEDWDAVCICAQHTETANFVEQVGPSEVDVYIAKPMATTLEAADRTVKAIRNNNLSASSGTTECFDGGIREAYRRFKSGAIGELISIRAFIPTNTAILAFPKGNWYWDEVQDGPEPSLIWDAADIVRWFADSEVDRMYTEYDNYLSENFPFMDNGKIILRFENRVMGSIDIYFSVNGFQFPCYEIELVGTTGGIRTQPSMYEGTLFTSAGVSNFYQ